MEWKWAMKANYNSCAGVAYQLESLDPLIDAKQCAVDAALMKTLGANAIRVYHVDSTADHKPCMDAFADAGIYLFLDLDTFNTQIEQVSVLHPPLELSANKILGQAAVE
jgi:1,3-beta-glucanosyltransferase GAS1